MKEPMVHSDGLVLLLTEKALGSPHRSPQWAELWHQWNGHLGKDGAEGGKMKIAVFCGRKAGWMGQCPS